MNTTLALGLAMTALGFAGYAVGIRVAYPGRAFSVTLLMLGLALAAVAGTEGIRDR